MKMITTSPGLRSRNSRMSSRASTIFVAPSSQTVWQRNTSFSPSPSERIPTLPASRSAAARVSGGSALTTLLRSRPSASKSVCTRPSLPSIPQCGSIRNRRIPSSSCCGMSWSWLAMNQLGSSAAENELWVPAKTTSLRRWLHSSGEPLQPSERLATARSRGLGPAVNTITATTTAARPTATAAIVRPKLRRRAVVSLGGVRPAADQEQQLAGAEVDEPGAEQQADDAERELPVEREDEPGDHRRQRRGRAARACSPGGASPTAARAPPDPSCGPGRAPPRRPRSRARPGRGSAPR